MHALRRLSDAAMTKYPKRPRDPAQLAKLIVDIATGEVEDGSGLPAAPLANPGGHSETKNPPAEGLKPAG